MVDNVAEIMGLGRMGTRFGDWRRVVDGECEFAFGGTYQR